MKTTEFKGKPVADSIKANIKERVSKLNEAGINPTFCLIRLGNKENDLSYERAIRKNCDNLGINLNVLELPEDISQEDLEDKIEAANKDDKTHGIMIFRPLPSHIDERKIAYAVNPDKDVDSMNPENLSRLFEGRKEGFVPCTPQAVIEILAYNNFNFEGANVVVLGRSLVVGKPLSMLFLDRNSTVTICHSRTKDLREITKGADVVVAALGKAKLIDDSYFNEDSIVIDVGVNVDDEGKLCGDVDYDNVFGKVKALTPVPGGVGSITTTVLMEHIVRACENMSK